MLIVEGGSKWWHFQRNKEKVIEDIGALRDKMKAMVQEASRKESAEAQLKEQVEKITKDVNRCVIMGGKNKPLFVTVSLGWLV